MVNETNVVLDRMECVCVCVRARVHPLSRFSRVRLFATLWTAARQAPLSMGFSRQECWSGLPCPPPGDLPNPGIKPVSLSSPALAGGFFTTSATWETPWSKYVSAEVSSFVLQILLASDEPVDSSHTNAF